MFRELSKISERSVEEEKDSSRKSKRSKISKKSKNPKVIYPHVVPVPFRFADLLLKFMKLTDHLKGKELELKELISIVDDRSLKEYLKDNSEI
jgi:hypothetical protein